MKSLTKAYRQMVWVTALALLTQAPLSAQPLEAAETTAPPAADDNRLAPALPQARIDWARNLIQVTGVGYPSQGSLDAGNLSQQRLTAIRAAQVVAYRQLALLVGQVRILDGLSVESYARNHKLEVTALIKYARRVGEPVLHPDGHAELMLEMPIYGPDGLTTGLPLPELLAGKPQPRPAPSGKADSTELSQQGFQMPDSYSALILDARGLAGVGSLLPRLCSPSHCLAPIQSADKLQAGWLSYASATEQVEAQYQGTGHQPLLIKVAQATASGNLLLSDLELNLIQQANAVHHFLEQQRVSVILDAPANPLEAAPEAPEAVDSPTDEPAAN